MEIYNYKATVIKVVDGDTVKLNIDLGFRMGWTVNCRLASINAPELGSGGESAKIYLEQLLPIFTEVHIKSTRLDKYGRPIVQLYLNGKDINSDLVQNGYATLIK